MKNILFVCDANQFRSVIAAEYFRYLLSKNNSLVEWNVGSAGTWATEGQPPLPEAISFANSRGLSIEHVRSREVSRENLAGAALVVVMTDGQKEALCLEFPEIKDHVVLLTEICAGQEYDIPDPVENPEEQFEDLATEICGLLDKGFERVLDRVSEM